MALDHGDLFFINRSGATYKIEAVELGEYLTGNQLNDGTYIVNDGLLSISNSGDPGDPVQPFVITSANTPLNSVIDFDINFVVRSVGNDASITLNYEHVSSEILCSDADGKTPGFLQDNCGGCISFDWDYFSDRLPCDNGGIINNNGCVKINLCSEGALILYETDIPTEMCLDVNLCGGSGIINNGRCLDLDYSLIASKLVCDPDNSGLNNGSGDSCITVNFEKVMAEMGLGVLRSADSSVLFTNNGDLTKGNVDLKVNPLVVQDTKINKIKATGKCLFIDGNDDLTIADVKINMNEACLKQYIQEIGGTGDGVSTPVKLLKPGDGITLNPTNGNLNNNDVTIGTDLSIGTGCDQVRDCLNIDDDDVNEDLCAKFGKLYANSAVFYKDADAQRPTIAMGAGRKENSTDKFVGITGSTAGGSFTVSTGPMADEPGECGVVPEQGKTDDTNIFFIRSNASEVKVGPIQNAVNAMSPNVCHTSRGRLAKVGGDSSGDSIVYTASNSTEVASFDVDSIIDTLTGGAGTTTTALDTGLIKFACYKDSVNKTLEGPIPYYPNIPTPIVFVEQLSQVHPSLVHWTWTDDSYEEGLDEYGEITYLLKENESDRVPVASDVNRNSLILLCLGAIGLQKRRNADLQDKVTALETTVAAMEARLAALESS